jgi:hypothetical protein
VQRAAARAGGTAYRYSGRRLALLVPLGDEETARRVCVELTDELGGDGIGLSTNVAVWRAGDDGAAVARRAFAATDGASPVAGA